MPYLRSQVDDFAWIVEETERIARHMDELRYRIASSAARRVKSGTQPAVTRLRPAPPVPTAPPPSESAERSAARTSCLSEVHRWLPPPLPPPHASRSGVREKIREAGRYCFLNPNRGRDDEELDKTG